MVKTPVDRSTIWDRGSNNPSSQNNNSSRPRTSGDVGKVPADRTQIWDRGGNNQSTKKNEVVRPSNGGKTPVDRGNQWDRGSNSRPTRPNDPSVTPSIKDRPTLSKPTRDAIANGQSPGRKPTVNNSKDVIPAAKPNRSENTLGGARPGEALIKPARGGDPQVLQGFKPGKLQPRANTANGNVGRNLQGGSSGGARDPQSVTGMRDADVKNHNAPPRERVSVNNKAVYNTNNNVIKPVSSSCGHGFCGGRSGCVYTYDYCDPIVYRPYGNCNNYYNGCDDDGWAFGFSFGYSSSNWGFGVGYTSSNWGIGVGYSSGYYNNWYNDCNYYQPVYSACYRPTWGYYGNWCAPAYYYRPYYCRPYYSLRYGYGAYYPTYPLYSAAYVPAYSNYWWLNDSSSNYTSGYDSGFEQGYETAVEQYTENGGYQPTWLAGGASTASASSHQAYEPPNAPAAAAPQLRANDGWVLLMTGDAREARRAFDREIVNSPGDGLPQIGYALAAGAMERYDDAIAAIRKAVREDPDSFREVPHDGRIADQIRGLLTHYRNVTREKPDDVNALFMSAALRYMMGEDALGYFAISKGIAAGDKDESAEILRAALQRALDAEPETVTVPSAAPASEPATAPAGPTAPRQF